MTRIPDTIDGLGRVTERWRQNPAFDMTSYAFDTDSYFIWSRFDGHATLKDIVLMVGLPVDRTVAIIGALRAAGGLLRPGENPQSVAAAKASEDRPRAGETGATEGPGEASAGTGAASAGPAAPSAGSGTAAMGKRTGGSGDAGERDRRARADTEPAFVEGPPDAAGRTTRVPAPEPERRPSRASAGRPELAQRRTQESAAPRAATIELTGDEAAAMALALELSEEVKERVIVMRRKVATADYFALFDVDRDSLDKKTLKRSYFRLSKEFHPDRYYGKKTGPFGAWLGEIFQAVSEGFQVLSDERSRERYLTTLGVSAPASGATQTREEYAAELFERAKAAEIAGRLPQALELFAAATRLVPENRYLVRAAHCALTARSFELARDYATRALENEPDNPSVLRLLAEAHALDGKLDAAERILLEALSKKTENDKLVAEIDRDLAAVRAQLGR